MVPNSWSIYLQHEASVYDSAYAAQACPRVMTQHHYFRKRPPVSSWRQIMDDGDTWLTAPVPTRSR